MQQIVSSRNQSYTIAALKIQSLHRTRKIALQGHFVGFPCQKTGRFYHVVQNGRAPVLEERMICIAENSVGLSIAINTDTIERVDPARTVCWLKIAGL